MTCQGSLLETPELEASGGDVNRRQIHTLCSNTAEGTEDSCTQGEQPPFLCDLCGIKNKWRSEAPGKAIGVTKARWAMSVRSFLGLDVNKCQVWKAKFLSLRGPGQRTRF